MQARQPHMFPKNQRLAIEGPSPKKANMFIFHLTDEHDGLSYPEKLCYREMGIKKEAIEEIPVSGESYGGPGDSGKYYFEYEYDSK